MQVVGLLKPSLNSLEVHLWAQPRSCLIGYSWSLLQRKAFWSVSVPSIGSRSGPSDAVWMHNVLWLFAECPPELCPALQVIAAPFPTGFNHSSIADLLHYKLERCKKVLGRSDLPVYGMGHSLGSLLHLLIATQYPVQRAGSILMSFNNKDVLESIPFFAPFLGPGARALGPVLSQVRPESNSTL